VIDRSNLVHLQSNINSRLSFNTLFVEQWKFISKELLIFWCQESLDGFGIKSHVGKQTLFFQLKVDVEKNGWFGLTIYEVGKKTLILALVQALNDN
jgi:hypothetical protein